VETFFRLAPEHERAKLAHHRKGQALLALGRPRDALEAFEKAKAQGYESDAQVAEARAQLDRAKTEAEKAAATPTPAPPPHVFDEPPRAAPAAATAQLAAATAAAPPKPRVREDWLQMGPKVQITLFAKGVPRDQVRASCPSSEHVEVHIAQLPDGSGEFRRQWRLFSSVKPESLALNVTPYKVEITLEKAAAFDWDALERPAAAELPAVQKRSNRVAESLPPAYSGKQVEWDRVERQVKEEEEKETPQGEEALMHLFRNIYKNADEDTRRAMIKSYQTSGGTVLSTNWKEVKEKNYESEIQPPKVRGARVSCAALAAHSVRARSQGQEVYKPPV
jgi:suppressor of G2 allele of SKP1